MPFFLPRKLVDFEYFDISSADETQQDEYARSYRQEVDFAFFVVNFGYTKSDYEQLTPCEKAFIYKAWEDKIVSDTTHLRNAFMNGYVNARRKKNKKVIPLWKKKQVSYADKEVVKANLDVVNEVELNEGKSWVEKIYTANNLELNGGGN